MINIRDHKSEGNIKDAPLLTKKILYAAIICAILFIFKETVCAELTKKDIEELRIIVREEVRSEVNHIDKRLDDINKRIDDTNRRIDDLKDLLYVILAGMFALIGFVLWDRRTALAPAIRKNKELEDKEEKIERALREIAAKDNNVADALRRVGLL
ncbi:MAG: hypothetical protein HY754_15015 [Nitrospirae bacterium]|nr:hypothetical protein [Nitrospirota bacterium]